MSILVTGGLGFIGAKVVLQLLKRDIPVVLADLDIEKNKIRLEKNIDKIGKDRKLASECGFGHVPIDIVRNKIKILVSTAKKL